jgi:hypothetical protein
MPEQINAVARSIGRATHAAPAAGAVALGGADTWIRKPQRPWCLLMQINVWTLPLFYQRN